MSASLDCPSVSVSAQQAKQTASMHNISLLIVLAAALLGDARKVNKLVRYPQATADCPVQAGVITGQMDDKVMEEASGLAYSRNQDGIIWTQNDHGDDPRVIAISEEGQRVAIVTLEGVLNEDWEDIATTVLDGESMLLVADTGNNAFDRDPLSIFRFKEPIVEDNEDMSITRDEIEDLQVRYPDFSYDCEALTVDQTSGDIFMFTKDRENSISEVYRYPFPQSEANNPFTLEHVATLPLFWITGGDISPDGNTLALTNKQEAFSFTKPEGISWPEFLVNNPEPCNLQVEEEVQREAIAVTEEGYWTTSECKKNPPCPLWFYAHSA